MKNTTLAFLLCNSNNRLVFVPGDEGPDGMRALGILRTIPEVAPGDPERLPLCVAPGDGAEETIWAMGRLMDLQVGLIGPLAVHSAHLPTLLGIAQAIESMLTAELPKPLALPVITPHNPRFMEGTQVLSLRIHDGRVVTEFFDIPPVGEDDHPELPLDENLFPAHD